MNTGFIGFGDTGPGGVSAGGSGIGASGIIPFRYTIAPQSPCVAATNLAITANRAYYVPFDVAKECVTAYFLVQIGTAAGNIDVGIYKRKFNLKVFSTGAFVCPAAGLGRIAMAVRLAPGRYYAAFSGSNAGAAITINIPINTNVDGCQHEVAGHPLPAVPTPVDNIANQWPLLGIEFKI